MMLNPTGGVVGDDYLLTQVLQEPGTHVCLTTPSASRVYRAIGKPAVQETHIQLGCCSSIEYLPDCVIPYRGSQFRQSLQLEMASGGRAVVWDSLSAGRVECGECWAFEEFDSRIEILLGGRPIYLNRMRFRPSELDPRRLGFMEEFHYMGTLVLAADQPHDWQKTVAELNAILRTLPRVRSGASTLTRSGCVAKLLAHSAHDLLLGQSLLWSRARHILFGLPPADLRKY